MSNNEPNREDANREDARRKHRAIALFCVIQCWIQKLDGITIYRSDLERLLGRVRFRKARVGWLCEDFKDFFPFYRDEYESYQNASGNFIEGQETFFSLTVSRIPLKPDIEFNSFKLWRLPTEEELDRIDNFIPFLADCGNRDYSILTLYLSLLAQGQVSPKAIPPLKEYYKSPEEIVDELMEKIARKLILEDKIVANTIANSNHRSGWLYDTYDKLHAFFKDDGGIEFFVEIIFNNKQDYNSVISFDDVIIKVSDLYSDYMTIKVNGELSYISKNWIIQKPKNVTIIRNNY
jgi:uncharacterized protein YeeX (DUF496 family)